MPLFSKSDVEIFYIHIPRTSGRYLKELFIKNGFDSKYHEFSRSDEIFGILPTHLHYPLYNKYLNVFDIEHFTVVRNPIERIWSALDITYKIHKPDNFFKNLENKSWFFDYINYERSIGSYHNNWFMPQYDFISHKTHVYKYEHGMDESFVKWFNKTFSQKIIKFDVDYYKMKPEIKNEEKYKITRKIKNNIKDYYIDDFKKFGY
jgi:hypothetical protein